MIHRDHLSLFVISIDDNVHVYFYKRDENRINLLGS